MHEMLKQVEKVCEDNEDILWWVKTYYEVDYLLDDLKAFHEVITVTTMEVLDEMFTQGHHCFLPLDMDMDATIDGIEFANYCVQLQQKKERKAA